jgi:SAM-dependent methyltransferase
MAGPSSETNLKTYETADVASHYASLSYLAPCERLLFDSYIKPGSAILDLGVGGGRTTPYLARLASHYVGVDYSAPMIARCRAKFPNLEFRVADASDLTRFQDGAFDAVVFAFNGIDYVLPDQSRLQSLAHIYRVLKADGCFIFSSHNPRAVVVREGWNRERLRNVAHRFSSGLPFLFEFLLVALAGARATLAIGRSVASSLLRFVRRFPTRTFWLGEGNFVDSAHGGLLTHSWIPERVIGEMAGLHFFLRRVVANEYPRSGHRYSTDWYYYVFTKR